MAKVGMWNRDRRRREASENKKATRASLLARKKALRKQYLQGDMDFEAVMQFQKDQQKMPRNALPVRVRNRCLKTGRPRAYYRRFGICRNVLRESVAEGLLPGVVKASW